MVLLSRLQVTYLDFIAFFLDDNDVLRLVHTGDKLLMQRLRQVSRLSIKAGLRVHFIDWSQCFSTLSNFCRLKSLSITSSKENQAYRRPLNVSGLPTTLTELKLCFRGILNHFSENPQLFSSLYNLDLLDLEQRDRLSSNRNRLTLFVLPKSISRLRLWASKFSTQQFGRSIGNERLDRDTSLWMALDDVEDSMARMKEFQTNIVVTNLSTNPHDLSPIFSHKSASSELTRLCLTLDGKRHIDFSILPPTLAEISLSFGKSVQTHPRVHMNEDMISAKRFPNLKILRWEYQMQREPMTWIWMTKLPRSLKSLKCRMQAYSAMKQEEANEVVQTFTARNNNMHAKWCEALFIPSLLKEFKVPKTGTEKSRKIPPELLKFFTGLDTLHMDTVTIRTKAETGAVKGAHKFSLSASWPHGPRTLTAIELVSTKDSIRSHDRTSEETTSGGENSLFSFSTPSTITSLSLSRISKQDVYALPSTLKTINFIVSDTTWDEICEICQQSPQRFPSLANVALSNQLFPATLSRTPLTVQTLDVKTVKTGKDDFDMTRLHSLKKLTIETTVIEETLLKMFAPDLRSLEIVVTPLLRSYNNFGLSSPLPRTLRRLTVRIRHNAENTTSSETTDSTHREQSGMEHFFESKSLQDFLVAERQYYKYLLRGLDYLNQLRISMVPFDRIQEEYSSDIENLKFSTFWRRTLSDWLILRVPFYGYFARQEGIVDPSRGSVHDRIERERIKSCFGDLVSLSRLEVEKETSGNGERKEETEELATHILLDEQRAIHNFETFSSRRSRVLPILTLTTASIPMLIVQSILLPLTGWFENKPSVFSLSYWLPSPTNVVTTAVTMAGPTTTVSFVTRAVQAILATLSWENLVSILKSVLPTLQTLNYIRVWYIISAISSTAFARRTHKQGLDMFNDFVGAGLPPNLVHDPKHPLSLRMTPYFKMFGRYLQISMLSLPMALGLTHPIFDASLLTLCTSEAFIFLGLVATKSM